MIAAYKELQIILLCSFLFSFPSVLILKLYYNMEPLDENQNISSGININYDFLSQAIGKEFKIKSYKVTPGTKPGDNFMSVLYSIEVQLQSNINGQELTRHLLIKCNPSHPSRQEFSNKCNIFFKELEIYRKWMPELRRFQTEVVGLKEALKLPYATYVHGQCIDFESEDDKKYVGKVVDALENYIIMEDLRKTWGFRMVDRRSNLDMDHMRLLISEIAKIHALSWAYKHHVEKNVVKKFPCLRPTFSPDDMELWTTMTYNNIDNAICLINQALGEGNELSKAIQDFRTIALDVFEVLFLGGDANIFKKLIRVHLSQSTDKESNANNGFEIHDDAADAEAPWLIISHGDCWSNNLLFRYDEKSGKPLEVVLVDLQLAGETCITNDLAYAIYSCTRTALRENHLNELLQLYHDRFNQICEAFRTETLPGFNMDSLKRRFHRSKLLGFYTATMILPIMLKEDEDTVNLEQIDPDKDLCEVFTEAIGNCGSKINVPLTDRLIEVTKELMDQEIL